MTRGAFVRRLAEHLRVLPNIEVIQERNHLVVNGLFVPVYSSRRTAWFAGRSWAGPSDQDISPAVARVLELLVDRDRAQAKSVKLDRACKQLEEIASAAGGRKLHAACWRIADVTVRIDDDCTVLVSRRVPDMGSAMVLCDMLNEVNV